MQDLAVVLAQAVDEGWSADKLAGRIRGMLLRPDRAEMIATTEIARVISTASMERYRDAAVEFVEWDTAYDKDVCKICKANEGAGPVRLGQEFPGGRIAPPQHPYCRCAPQPVLDPPGGV
jgi:SPP1 gp7 family putative phage head morphogenesis protein